MFNICSAYELQFFSELQQNSVSNIFRAYYNFKLISLSILNGQTLHSIVWNAILPTFIIVLMNLLLLLIRYGSY